MTGNSQRNGEFPGNFPSRHRFVELFQKHWREGTGRKLGLGATGPGWSEVTFARAVTKGEFGECPETKTITAWKDGKRWPQEDSKNIILKVFFTGKSHADPDRMAMEDAWTEGQRESPPRRKARLEDSSVPQKWVISRHVTTEGLADLRLHQPSPLNEEGSYRVEASARLDIAPFEHDRQDYAIGVTTVLLAVESEAYQVTRGSMIGERPTELPARVRADGVELTGPRDPANGCIVGDLLNGEHVAHIESLYDGEAPVFVSLRAARRAFKVLGLGAQGRNTPIAVSEETDAVLNILLGKDREKDSLGRVVLAKMSMARKPV